MTTIGSISNAVPVTSIPVNPVRQEANKLIPHALGNIEVQFVNKVAPSAMDYASRSVGQWAGGMLSLVGAVTLLPIPGLNLLTIPLVGITGVSHIFSGMNFLKSIVKGVSELK